jgi:drug/metabolite transporter (DMT)-like permease
MKNLFILILVMTAFATNSIITRLALSSNLIGPSNFALLRAGSAALILVLLVIFIQKKIPKFKINSIISALALVGYLVGFSFAYLTINTGIGALILFGGSMIVMFTGALLIKEDISALRFIGVFLSLIGLYILTDPRFGENSLFGIILMFLAAFSWGIYSILGHRQNNPLSNTAINFVLAFLLIIPFTLFIPDNTNTSPYGFLLAIISGSITSGLGYTLWYWILPKINIASASIAQLSVPLIAALGGYLFISETLNWQFYIASFLILGGIGLPYFFKK